MVHAQGLPQPSPEQGSAPGAARLFPALWAGHRAQEPHVSAPWIWALSGAGYSSCCLPSFSPPARPSSLISRQALLTMPLHPVSRIPYSSAAPRTTSNAVAISISTLNEFSLYLLPCLSMLSLLHSYPFLLWRHILRCVSACAENRSFVAEKEFQLQFPVSSEKP